MRWLSRVLVRGVVIAAAVGLTGCAARVFPVPLSIPSGMPQKVRVTVVDDRLDKQLLITAVSWDSTVAVYLLEAEPSLQEALQRVIAQTLAGSSAESSALAVSLEELDLRSRVGFARSDHVTCRIVSKVSSAKGIFPVKTLSTNTTNMSPFVYDAAKAGLDQCLREHSEAILAAAL